MELLKKVGDHESFVFRNEQINHIEDLVAALSDATDEEYSIYANEDKNDFANWIEHVLNNKDVADKLRGSVSKDDTVSLLKAEISSRTQESVLESKESILGQVPVERPEKVEIENPISSPEIAAPAEPAPIVSEAYPIEPVAVVSEPPVAVEESVVKPVEVSEPVSPLVTEEIKPLEESVDSVPTPLGEDPVVPISETISEPDSIAPVSKSASIESSESIIPNVVTPINEEDINKIQSKSEPHHFCGVHMDCMRREFIFGLVIGLLIGLVGLQMIHSIL